MVKKLLLSFLVIGAIAVSALAYVTRDTAVSHAVLRDTGLPALIPTRAFYADPRAAYGYIASPDIKYVTHMQAGLSGLKRVVREIDSGEIIAEFASTVSNVRWHPTEHKLRFVHQHNDWEADIFNADAKHWIRTTPVKLSGGWRKNGIATNTTEKVLTWGRVHQRWPGHMWLVSQDGLEAEKVAEGIHSTQYWVFNNQQQPVLRFDSLDPATTQVMYKTDDDWVPLLTVDLGDRFYPVSNVRDNGTILMISSRGRDKSALVSFDPVSVEETVVLQHAGSDIGFTTSLTTAPEPDLISLGANTFEQQPLTERGEIFLDILNEFEQPVGLGAVLPTATGRYFTAAISPNGKSWVYLLVDLQTKTSRQIGEFHFRRFKNLLVQPQTVSIVARDGLQLPAILTMPRNPAGPIPFIVKVHGGPAAHTRIDYNHDTQFLVNRGYGVLNVNFRGSTGFGKKFQQAGFRQFGRAMQDDITDAAQWLIDNQLADPDALIVMGMSYGGYAAALAMTRDPGLFSAGIVEFPMLDPEFQSKHHPGFWEESLDGWWRYFGKPDNPQDLDTMQKFSPLNRVAELHGPLLILAGLRDQVTAVQQVRNFEAAADNHEKNVTTHYFEDVGHGVYKWRDKLKRARLLEDFLAKHAGGRSGGVELVDYAPSFIR